MVAGMAADVAKHWLQKYAARFYKQIGDVELYQKFGKAALNILKELAKSWPS